MFFLSLFLMSLYYSSQIGNHDKHRVASRFRDGLVDAFNMLVLLLPGIAITYMASRIYSLFSSFPLQYNLDEISPENPLFCCMSEV